MDRDSVAKTFWQRVSVRQAELSITAKKIQADTEKVTGKTYRFTEAKCRNVLPDTYTICVLASILRTTTDYLLGFINESGTISVVENEIITAYRNDRHVRAIVDNLLELTHTDLL